MGVACGLVSGVAADPAPVQPAVAGFYTQRIDANGLPVLGSAQPAKAALEAARGIVLNMLSHRTDILEQLKKAGVRVAVIGAGEVTTDLPEYATLTPADWWNRRTRGVGATAARPVCSAGEENLLGLPGDRYVGESILIHEFAHTLFDLGLLRLQRDARRTLQGLYARAMDAGRWHNTYAATDAKEYWAEGVQCWFDANPRGLTAANGIHGPVATREALTQYDPALAQFIATVLGPVAWRWDRPGLHATR